MKTINLKNEQVELLVALLNETIERLYVQFENTQTEDTLDKLADYSDKIMEFYYEVTSQLNKPDDEIGYIRSQIATISSFLEDARKEGDQIGIMQYQSLLYELNQKFNKLIDDDWSDDGNNEPEDILY